MFLEIIIVGILVGFLVIFLNYCLGKPGSEHFSPYEVFSSYTVWLSKRRLKQVGLMRQYDHQYDENTERMRTKHERIQFNNDFKKILYEGAEPFFTWERAAGMCPICFGVWVAFVCWNVYLQVFDYHGFNIAFNLIFLLIVIITSHVTIRLLTKII